MSDETTAGIASLKSLLQKQEEEVRATKRTINQLCKRGGLAMDYPDVDDENAASLGSMRRDQFYGQPLATAIRQYLEMRKAIGAATVNDIYEALRSGGFVFEAKNAANAKRSLYISLAKNSVTFHKLRGGADDDGAVFGLLDWYPNAKADDEPKKIKKGKKAKKVKAKVVEEVAEPVKAATTAKKPEKGVSHEESKGAGSAARKKHNPAPVA